MRNWNLAVLVAGWVALYFSGGAFAESPQWHPWQQETRWTEAQLFQWYQDIENGSSERKTGLDANERQAIFQAVARHPIASLASVDRYDGQQIGFCFGRAMAAQLLAREWGLSRASIRKLFIVGDLRSGEVPEWRFHVTTLVRGAEDGAWYAVDPVLEYLTPTVETAIPMEDWVSRVRATWDRNAQAKLYFVAPSAVLPDITTFPLHETGRRLIEISFEPWRHPGFTPFGNLEKGFAPTAEVERANFLEALPGTKRFDFLHLAVSDERGQAMEDFDYHGYFGDLLSSLRGVKAMHGVRPRALEAPAAAQSAPLGFGSASLPSGEPR